MKAIFHKCYDDYGNLKDNALNIAYNLGKKEGLRKGKKIAKAEFIEEVKDGLKALKDKGYSTYYIDDELVYLEQLKEQK